MSIVEKLQKLGYNGADIHWLHSFYDIGFKIKDQTKENMGEWIKGLNASGYAGILPENGWVVDRREFNNAIPVQKNSMFRVVEPKEL